MIADLPTSLMVDGVEYRIRTHFKDIINILVAFEDPDLEDSEKVYICLYILYKDFEGNLEEGIEPMPSKSYENALQEAIAFIDCGMKKDSKKSPRTMDWSQDAQIMFPAINKVAGCEVRSLPYLHWWTFMGYFMEISEGTFSQVLNLRNKKAKGKKLEKWEKEFWEANKHICVLKVRISKEEQEAKDRLNAMLNANVNNRNITR